MKVSDGEEIYDKKWVDWTPNETIEWVEALELADLGSPIAIKCSLENWDAASKQVKDKISELRMANNMTESTNQSTTPSIFKHMVFVYGSLKKGFRNNSAFLQTAKYVGKAITLDSHYAMKSCGGFPVVTRGGIFGVEGELYEVNDLVLRNIDLLESNGSLYRREVVPIVSLADNGNIVTAWLYFWTHDTNHLCQVGVTQSAIRNVMCQSWGVGYALPKNRSAAAKSFVPLGKPATEKDVQKEFTVEFEMEDSDTPWYTHMARYEESMEIKHFRMRHGRK